MKLEELIKATFSKSNNVKAVFIEGDSGPFHNLTTFYLGNGVLSRKEILELETELVNKTEDGDIIGFNIRRYNRDKFEEYMSSKNWRLIYSK